MPEAILVLLRHPEEAGLLLDAAARLADIMGSARVNALAIHETIEVTPAGALTLADRSDAILAAKDEERRRVAALERLFASWSASAARRGAEAHWCAAEGSTTDIVAQ